MPTTFETISDIDLLLGLANLALLVYLFVVYLRLYLELRQKFTLAFLLFSALLILNNLSGTGFYLRRFVTGPIGPLPPSGPERPFSNEGALLFLRLVPSVLQFVALVILVWITRE
ncbi:MAG: hypothetical protein ACYDDF_00685 [Thermoplasmatota archaeon]